MIRKSKLYPLYRGFRLLTTADFYQAICIDSRFARCLPTFTMYLNRQPVIGYIGWLGHKNVGDDILFASFQKMIPNHELIMYNKPLPVEFGAKKVLCGSGLWRFVFVGGGTLIYDRGYVEHLERAITAGKPLVVYGTGAKDLRLGSPDHSPLDLRLRHRWNDVLRAASYIGVRGPLSAKALAEANIDAKIIGDPALSVVSWARPRRSGRKRIAINLCETAMWGTAEALIKPVSELCRCLLREGFAVEFIILYKDDLKPLSMLSQHLGDHLTWIDCRDKFENFPRVLDRYEVVIAQRLHAAVVAHAIGVPVLGLEYRPKVLDHMRSMEVEEYCIRTDRIKALDMKERLDEILGSLQNHSQHLVERAAHFRRTQRVVMRELISKFA